MAGFWRSRSVSAVGCIGLSALLGLSSGCARSGSDAEGADLARLAHDIRAAVLARDVDALLRYARRDIRNDPTLVEPLRPALREYLVVTVREVLTTARDLQVRVEDLGRGDDGVRWARIVFYDRAVVPEAALDHRDFLCEHDLKNAVAWTFQYVEGWESIGYPFDAFTDIHCPPDSPSRSGANRATAARTWRDLDERLQLELDRRVIDPAARVQERVELFQDLVALGDRVDHNVGAHRVPARRQRPGVQIVHPAHSGHRPDGGVHLIEVPVRGRALEQDVHRLLQ
jgi:hypothetical protein